MGRASTPPSVYGEGANRPLLLRRDACVQSSAPRMPPTSRTPPHAAPRAGRVGSAAREGTYRDKNRPTYPRTVFGPRPNPRLRLCVAQARGILLVYKKRGTLFVPL